jgi:hypothetical protein
MTTYGYRLTYKNDRGAAKQKTIFVPKQNKSLARSRAIYEYLILPSNIITLRFCSC